MALYGLGAMGGTAHWHHGKNKNLDAFFSRAFSSQKQAVENKAVESKAVEKVDPLQTQRQSMFSSKDVEDIEMQEQEAMQNENAVFRKRRGSIFGNNSDTIFGN